MNTENGFFQLDFLVSNKVIDSVQLLGSLPPKGELVLLGRNDLHFDTNTRIEFRLNNSEYDCRTWSRINEDKLATILAYKLKSAEMAIEVSGEIVYRIKAIDESELKVEITKQLQQYKSGVKVIMSNILYEGSDGKMREIEKTEFDMK